MQGSNTRKPKRNRRIEPRPRGTRVNFFFVPKRFKRTISRAVALSFDSERIGKPSEIAFILLNDRLIKSINRRFRKTNRVTDVISFKVNDDPLCGDVFIAEGRSKRQAKEAGHSWERELAYLAIHGVFHLFGYSDYSAGRRREMFKKQDAVWKKQFGLT
ncbi:MAG: rRNA maturation RNase YbeY [Endomicrobiales bacterium]|nr:rRNA maturation RNase YbeY [Endomicrobiales bacterium]